MRIKEISVEKGRTINLGKFNTVVFRYGVKAELDERESHEEVFEKLDKEVDKMVDREHAFWQK